MALAHHDAAHRHQRRGADAEFLRAQHRRDHHVAPGLDAAVGAQPHAVAQAVQHQHLVRLGQAHLPRHAGIFDRGSAASAPVPPVWPEIRMTSALALATPAAIVPMPVRATSFTQTARVGIDLLEVVDELRQVLDRIDVVVRRRRDQHDAGRGMAQLGDHLGHLEAGQLAALAGLGALGDLDLDLAAFVQVFGGHAEAARRDLLDRRVRIVAVRPRAWRGAGPRRPRPSRTCAPMRFMAMDSVSCASGPSAPSDMPGATKRLRISVMLSTSSSEIGCTASVRKSSRSRSAIGGSRRTPSE